MYKQPIIPIKVAAVIYILLWSSGCVEFRCYSNLDYAIEAARAFCDQAKDNKTLCESLKILDKNICSFSKKSSKCNPLGHSIKMFARISYPDCKELDETKCRAEKVCKWTFDDPNFMNFMDFRD